MKGYSISLGGDIGIEERSYRKKYILAVPSVGLVEGWAVGNKIIMDDFPKTLGRFWW